MRRMKVKAILIGILICILTVLYSYFVADTITTRITDAQMTKIDNRFMIATESRPFLNEDVWYRFKFDSGTVQNEAIRLKGEMVKIKKIRMEDTFTSRYENMVKFEEVKRTACSGVFLLPMNFTVAHYVQRMMLIILTALTNAEISRRTGVNMT